MVLFLLLKFTAIRVGGETREEKTTGARKCEGLWLFAYLIYCYSNPCTEIFFSGFLNYSKCVFGANMLLSFSAI